jgi:hypothetical protein
MHGLIYWEIDWLTHSDICLSDTESMDHVCGMGELGRSWSGGVSTSERNIEISCAYTRTKFWIRQANKIITTLCA